MAAWQILLERPAGPVRVRSRSRGAEAIRTAPLDEAAKGQVHRQWRLGASVEVLAEEYGRSGAGIERVINEVRAHRILEQTLDYIYHPSFDASGAESTILGPVPAATRSTKAAIRPPAELPPYLASLYNEAALLSADQEAHLFRKMNYLKYRAVRLREALDPASARTSELDEIERLQGEALAIKNQIIRANLRLVVSIARKRVGPTHDFFELVSDGNMSLIRAVEKFDVSRGFKFSTYACWAMIKNFARAIPEEKNRRDRFVTGHGELFEAAADHRGDERASESDHWRNQQTVQGMLGHLNDRERQILVRRFGLGGASETTLEQLGKEMGITKERVRQIESRAQEKLRKLAREQRLDLPAA
jgi:RNA polymerase primary sigma factor